MTQLDGSSVSECALLLIKKKKSAGVDILDSKQVQFLSGLNMHNTLGVNHKKTLKDTEMADLI